MNVSCILCNRQVETKNEDVVVTVNWVFDDLVKKNNVKCEKSLPRIVKTCKNCWNDNFKTKPDGTDYYWVFNKEV